jgi:hypothetical protein
MAKCDFPLEFAGSHDELMNQARQAIQSVGGSFNGDAAAGAFELKTPLGTVKGNYSIQEKAIRVQITEKPLLLSCGRIEAELRSYLLR